jgi:hypothetical protein
MQDNRLELLAIIEHQGDMIAKQLETIKSLVNENAEKEALITSLLSGE